MNHPPNLYEEVFHFKCGEVINQEPTLRSLGRMLVIPGLGIEVRNSSIIETGPKPSLVTWGHHRSIREKRAASVAKRERRQNQLQNSVLSSNPKKCADEKWATHQIESATSGRRPETEVALDAGSAKKSSR